MKTQKKTQQAEKLQSIIQAEDADFAAMLFEYAEIMQAQDLRGRVEIAGIARKAGALSERLRGCAWSFVSHLLGEGAQA